MNVEAFAIWLLLIALVGAVIFARMGMLGDYLLSVAIAAGLFALFFFLESMIRSALHL